MRGNKLTALCLTMLLLPGLAAAVVVKQESVYAKLDGAGNPVSIHVVNSFEVDGPCDITDYGEYTAVVNLSKTSGLRYEGGQASFSMDKGRFYYQGRLDGRPLPWNIAISYTLDGVPADAGSLSGASGKLEAAIAVTKNPDVAPGFADSFTLQLLVTLDGDCCLSIRAPLGTIAAAGKDRTIAFVLLPGMEATYAFSAEVTDFHMPGIQISGLSMNMDTEMYVKAFTAGLADSPMSGVIKTMAENMMAGMSARTVGSFVSPLNTGDVSVQFVMMTEEIPPKAAPAPPEAEQETEQGFFARVLALFGL